MIPLTNAAGRRFYVLRRISTGEIINPRALWPNADENAAITGLDPDLQYLPISTQAEPDYDPRIFTLVKHEAPAASGTEWHVTFSTERRPLNECRVNAQNTESDQNSRHYAAQERDKLMILGLAVLFRQTANQQLTAREVALKSRIIDLGARIWNNDQRLRAIFTALDAGQTPDLDAGWEQTA